MNQQIERRNFTHEFRVSSDGEPAKISGYAAIFDSPSENMGGWTETIDPHAFDSVLSGQPDVRALFNHNPDLILGRTKADTLSLSIDANGLAYTILPPDTSQSNDLLVSMRRGDITQSSFSFTCKRDQWTDNADGTATRRILEFNEIFDISPVTYPAYNATTSQVRSIPASMPTEIRSRIEIRADEPKTKTVNGHLLTADCFLIVLDPARTDTWHLPYKFPSDDDTKSHLRNALARFDQLKDIPQSVLDKAWKQLLQLCKQYGIDASAESKSIRSYDITDDECLCGCPQCTAGACGICSANPQCIGASRSFIPDREVRRMKMRLDLLALK